MKKLDIIYEDKELIVVNKPTKLLTISDGVTNRTLYNMVSDYVKKQHKQNKIFIVHRLDKDTSGLIIVAKNDNAHINVSEQIKNHEVTKIYTALVRGNIEEDEATINMPIARDERDRKKMATDIDGKEAVTHFTVIKRYYDYTLLKVKIDTGRTHQIRVHMAKIHHPVVGDEVYSNGKNEFNVKGQLLHSTILEFKHPRTGEKLHFEAPLPDEFKRVLDDLDKRGK